MAIDIREIGIVGVGKLGLCLALLLDRAGYEVTGVDLSADYVRALNQRVLDSPEPRVSRMLSSAVNFQATTDLEVLHRKGIKMIFLVVATPSMADGGYDHSQLDEVLDAFAAFGPVPEPVDLVVVCTTMPGYIDSVRDKVESLGYRLSYNPEFIAQGRIIDDLLQPDQVLIGEHDAAAGAAIESVWRRMVDNEPAFCRMSPISAEICKIATNCFLTTKISFANSIGDLALKAGAEPDKILAAIGSDSRIGPKYLNYGFGYGGPCFPRDNRALGKFGDEVGYELLISKATDQVNQRHLEFQFQEWMNRYTPDEVIDFHSVTYKKGTNILEESQQLALALRLAQAGRKVRITDREDVIREIESLYPGVFVLEPVALNSQTPG